MKTEYQIIAIIFIHWVADFLLQTQKMAMNKSKDNYWLFAHVFVYSMAWFFIGLFFFKPMPVILFTVTTFICHFITDYLTSRWTSKLYKQEKYYGFPAFFSVIGLDQFLHYLQLILCYEYFTTL
jgi:hypothetical protein